MVKEIEILDILTKHFKKEFALCHTFDNRKILIEGELNRVEIPKNLNCKYVIHTHLYSINPSPADLKASYFFPVCVLHNKTLKCFKDSKEINIILEEISHHDAAYNLKEIVKELILLEEHYVTNPCADCISKHLLKVSALAEEALTLNNAKKYELILKEVLNIAEKHFNIVNSFLTHGNQNYNLMDMAQEIREIRKKILKEIFNVDEIPHHLHENVKKDQWNWEQLKPKTKSQREEIYQKYGSQCFLRPQDLGFPICNFRGEIDCDGLRAAFVRAKAAKSAAEKVNKLDLAKEYEEIAQKAKELAKKYNCLWVKEEL
ncbi:MAG: hypothetical protein QW648_00850 [Nanoarchaeales archaeon]